VPELTDRELLERIVHQGERNMAAIDDLNAAVANLVTEQAAVTTAIADLDAEVLALQNAVTQGDTAAIEAAVQSITNVNTALQQAAANDPGPQRVATAAVLTSGLPGTELASSGKVGEPAPFTGGTFTALAPTGTVSPTTGAVPTEP
jgi:hypothetical protein